MQWVLFISTGGNERRRFRYARFGARFLLAFSIIFGCFFLQVKIQRETFGAKKVGVALFVQFVVVVAIYLDPFTTWLAEFIFPLNARIVGVNDNWDWDWWVYARIVFFVLGVVGLIVYYILWNHFVDM